jgi:hypothetical protein
VAKEMFQSKPESRRKAGRPRMIWMEDTQNVLQELKVKRWRQKAKNRDLL